MAASETRVLLVDDLRSFVDGRSAEVARTSAAGVRLLHRYRDGRLDELWLDHDLGEDDTIWPVVEVLERAAFEGRPYDIGVIKVHSANPGGASRIAQVLRHWGYRVHVASGSSDVGYLELPGDRGQCGGRPVAPPNHVDSGP
ncbi:cyclic-phosphate processing receiver domain-containing protein [Micromonospora vinacea]|uniref:cyclic-phosphate processing receiver domain-containing protein n=1 Tax=Micromonospora vinacea TaxID=709878 RepID=UPI003D8B7A8D